MDNEIFAKNQQISAYFAKMFFYQYVMASPYCTNFFGPLAIPLIQLHLKKFAEWMDNNDGIIHESSRFKYSTNQCA